MSAMGKATPDKDGKLIMDRAWERVQQKVSCVVGAVRCGARSIVPVSTTFFVVDFFFFFLYSIFFFFFFFFFSRQ
jgi:hypothetical protein